MSSRRHHHRQPSQPVPTNPAGSEGGRRLFLGLAAVLGLAMHRRAQFVKPIIFFVAVAFLAVCGSTAVRAAVPNVILILADDLGYETIGANGGTSYQTPVLDKLAATGVRFEHCYVQPLCTPTRMQLMTGIYNVRNYVTFGQMDPQSVTFGNLFKRAGYATCITGKWQLGRELELPKKFGFDEHCLWQHTRRPPRYANPGLEINGREVNHGQTHRQVGDATR